MEGWELNWVPEIYWAEVYHDTIIGSEWLSDKKISPAGPRSWAVGYNFLYALYRVLDEMKPTCILELGLGQSSKLTAQFADYYGASHYIIEHDKDWVEFFLHGWNKFSERTKIMITPLVQDNLNGAKYLAYDGFDKIIHGIGHTFDLVLIDGPFGGDEGASRRDMIPYIPKCLADDFIIIIDDCGRDGEKNLIREIRHILDQSGIDHVYGRYKSGSACHVGLICSQRLRFFASM